MSPTRGLPHIVSINRNYYRDGDFADFFILFLAANAGLWIGTHQLHRRLHEILTKLGWRWSEICRVTAKVAGFFFFKICPHPCYRHRLERGGNQGWESTTVANGNLPYTCMYHRTWSEIVRSHSHNFLTRPRDHLERDIFFLNCQILKLNQRKIDTVKSLVH